MKYRHKKTGDYAEISNNDYYHLQADGRSIPKRFIENSCDWELIIEDEIPVGTIVRDMLSYEDKYEKKADGWFYLSVNIKDKGIMIRPDNIGKDKRYQIVVEEKKKTPIFTTEDGKEIFEGDNYWVVDIKNQTISVSYGDKCLIMLEKYKRFSSKELANEYIIKHSKILSLKDICKSKGGDIEKSMLYIDLKKLVEERIKNK